MVIDYREILIEAVGTLRINKLRTGLAVLGIIIGIGSVIALVSLGESAKHAVSAQIQSVGANLLTVIPGFQSTGGVRGAAGGGTTLTYDDAKAIEDTAELSMIKRVSPEYTGRRQVTAGRNNTNTQIVGVVPAYSEVRRLEMDSGSFVTQGDVVGMSKVAVLGPTVAQDLFGMGTDAVGRTIRIDRLAFRVVGVTVAKGGTGLGNQDDRVYIPLTTAQRQLFGVKHVSAVVVEVENEEIMAEAQNEVGYFLLSRHKLSDPGEKDFTIISQQDILNTATAVTGTFTTMLSGVAAISLLVGGIGIMNIMLVTVTERTREIGLRKALGAKRRVILMQFLTESVILTFTGGVVGMCFGILGFWGYARLSHSVFVVSPSSVILAFVVSAGIGIVFGWYPAWKAASLQPIEALRYE